MKKILLISIFSLGYMFSQAQIDSVIYGISVVSSGTGLYLAKISAQSGVVTNISQNAVSFTSGYNGRAIDPVNHIFYQCLDSVLLKFNLQTGDLLEAVQLIQYQTSMFYGLEYNCVDSTLYGLAWDNTGQAVWLASLDPNTGVVDIISGNPIAPSYRILTYTTLDPYHNIFYFETTNNMLIGVDFQSGGIISESVIDLPSGQYFGPIIFNCYDSIVYGLAGNMTLGRKLAMINPNTGEVTLISQNIIANSIQNNPATLDPFQEYYYFIGGDTTFNAADLQTGELVVSSPIIPFPGTYFANFFYNHPCLEIQVIVHDFGKKSISIFPNPADDQITIKIFSGTINSIQLVDIFGKVLYSGNKVIDLRITINSEVIPEGFYYLIVHTSEGFFVEKIIVKHNTL
ncbi:MAG: T9SS type A sorting domain-containing protein [Bacteroidota bacterium]